MYWRQTLINFTLSATAFADQLLHWYDNNRRYLPWRENPTPYHVWISEIMLQQTQVQTVLPYFHRFTAALPNVSALASVSQDRLHKLWEGLGYYSRADNLHKAAQIVVSEHDGQLPEDYETLLSLPGIGPYTAGAIASIAFGQRVCAVDGNVLRILSRMSAYDGPINVASSAKPLQHLAQSLVPAHRPGDFNQALMDLGAMVCSANGSPHCKCCPVANGCLAKEKALTGILPIKKPKKPRSIEYHGIVILTTNNQVWIRKRPSGQLLAGLWEFLDYPDLLDDDSLSKQLISLCLTPDSIDSLGAARHIFTHKEWHMMGWLVHLPRPATLEGGQWVDVSALETTYAMAGAIAFYRSKLFEYFL